MKQSMLNSTIPAIQNAKSQMAWSTGERTGADLIKSTQPKLKKTWFYGYCTNLQSKKANFDMKKKNLINRKLFFCVCI